MLEFDARKFPIDAIKAARIALPPKALSPAALKVAAQPTVPAYSPIVLAGAVRLIELAITVLVGAALGAVLAAIASRLLASLLPETAPFDVAAVAAAVALLVATAAAAAAIPASRVLRLDPLAILRQA